MATHPTSAISRSFNKSNVTRWINKIKDYQNVSVDLIIKNTPLVGEEFLIRHYNEYVKLKWRCLRFEISQRHPGRLRQNKIPSGQEGRRIPRGPGYRKSKTDQYEKQQEEERSQASDRSLATLLEITQKSTAALREQEREEQDRRDRQQEMQQRRDLIEKLINTFNAGQPVSAPAVAENAAKKQETTGKLSKYSRIS